MPKGKKTGSDGNVPTKDNLRWTDEMDMVLLNALQEESHKGNKHDGAWTTEAYCNMLEVLRTTFGPHITKQHIKNIMKTLKEHFAEAYDLFHSLSGFAWNPITRKFEAEEEVWCDLIKDKPYAAKWKKMQIKHYDTMMELFGADRATGKYAQSARDKIQQLERQHIDLNDSFEGIGFSEPEIEMGNETGYSAGNMDTFSPTYGHTNQSGGTSSSRGTKRKTPMVDVMEREYEKLNMGINTLAEALRDGNYMFDKLHTVAERQVAIAERQVDIAERGLIILE